ncbi:DUF3822 family protein [Parapedobacter sp. DT-150]|uniref:DUF3822 family protein n=1 Tax=Parapedobacter sp. DT-150 TaxID=3396162 RepID=UPI003F1A9F57
MTYTSADFDQWHAADYTLLVGVGYGENALAIVDHDQQLKLLTTYDPNHVEQWIGDVLNQPFGNVKLAVSDSAYSFVPADVFEEHLVDTYQQYLPGDGLSDVAVSAVPSSGIKLLHRINRLDLAPFAARFPQLAIYPRIQSLLSGVSEYAQSGGPSVIIDKQASAVSICVFDKGHLVYANDFEVTDPDDFNYYLLSVLANTGLTEEQPACWLAGDLTQDDAFYQRVSKYSEAVNFVDSGQLTGIHLPDELKREQHGYFTLLALYLCE